jgi:hypothetical protein
MKIRILRIKNHRTSSNDDPVVTGSYKKKLLILRLPNFTVSSNAFGDSLILDGGAEGD